MSGAAGRALKDETKAVAADRAGHDRANAVAIAGDPLCRSFQ